MWVIDPKIKIEKVSMAFFKNIEESDVKIYRKFTQMAGWQTTVGNLQNICFQYKVFDENLLWKVHTAGRLTGSQVRVRIVDAWTSSPSSAVSSSHDNYHNGGAGDAEDGESDD